MATALTVVFGAVPNLLLEVVPSDRASESAGLAQVTRTLGIAVGRQLLAVTLATSTVSDPSHGPGRYPTESAYLMAFIGVAASCALMLLCSLALPRSASSRATLGKAVLTPGNP